MRISHRKKFVYIAVPKTASSSIKVLLEPYVDVKSEDLGITHEHLRAVELKKIFAEKGWDWDSYYKFAVVRNPWAIQFSLDQYTRHVAQNPPSAYHQKNPSFYLRCLEHLKQCPTFRDSIKERYMLGAQTWFFSDDDGNLLIDFIAKYENLEADLVKIWTHLGLDPTEIAKLPRKNTSASRNFRDAYDEETKNIVAEFCRSDIERFNYSFDQD